MQVYVHIIHDSDEAFADTAGRIARSIAMAGGDASVAEHEADAVDSPWSSVPERSDVGVHIGHGRIYLKRTRGCLFKDNDPDSWYDDQPDEQADIRELYGDPAPYGAVRYGDLTRSLQYGLRLPLIIDTTLDSHPPCDEGALGAMWRAFGRPLREIQQDLLDRSSGGGSRFAKRSRWRPRRQIVPFLESVLELVGPPDPLVINGAVIRSSVWVPHVPARLVFLNACRSGDTPDLIEAFHARGTRWVIALRGAQWGDEVDGACIDFFRRWGQDDFDDDAVEHAFNGSNLGNLAVLVEAG